MRRAWEWSNQGYAAMTTFYRCMNISPPVMAQTTLQELNSDLNNAYVQTAPATQESMQWQKLCKNCLQ